jgi:2-methylisocitrate lyase-like PEP mutase family enzyme
MNNDTLVKPAAGGASKAKLFRALIAENKPIVTPTAHDALSARLIAMLGFKAIALGGSTMLASRYGLPDLGIAGFAEMQETTRDIVTSVAIPCIADADDGYGDLKSVVRTVRAFEDAGVAALVLEDQDRMAKRPGDSAAFSVGDAAALAAKIRTAIAYRRNPDTLVVARSDSYAVEGVDGALRRCEAYLNAGADGIFVPGVSNHEHLAIIGKSFPGVFKLLVQVEGSQTPWLSVTELHSMGFAQITYPSYILNRALLAMESACNELHRATTAGTAPSLLPELTQVRARFNAAVDIDSWRGIETGASSK